MKKYYVAYYIRGWSVWERGKRGWRGEIIRDARPVKYDLTLAGAHHYAGYMNRLYENACREIPESYSTL